MDGVSEITNLFQSLETEYHTVRSSPESIRLIVNTAKSVKYLIDLAKLFSKSGSEDTNEEDDEAFITYIIENYDVFMNSISGNRDDYILHMRRIGFNEDQANNIGLVFIKLNDMVQKTKLNFFQILPIITKVSKTTLAKVVCASTKNLQFNFA